MHSIPSADLYMEHSSNALLYYNNSRGVEEGFEQMKLTETVEKKLVNYYFVVMGKGARERVSFVHVCMYIAIQL